MANIHIMQVAYLISRKECFQKKTKKKRHWFERYTEFSLQATSKLVISDVLYKKPGYMVDILDIWLISLISGWYPWYPTNRHSVETWLYLFLLFFSSILLLCIHWHVANSQVYPDNIFHIILIICANTYLISGILLKLGQFFIEYTLWYLADILGIMKSGV